PGYKGGFNSDRPRTPRGEGSFERKSYGSDSKPFNHGYKGGFKKEGFGSGTSKRSNGDKPNYGSKRANSNGSQGFRKRSPKTNDEPFSDES
ncbi:MAG: hypothetical protein JHC93_07370, partial [Parachlamydiales bacterium]|nr:hypothetical protein [Parachlamydiales bacterium]